MYCAGGLKRHIDYGFKTEEWMRRHKKKLLYKIQVRDAPLRVADALELFSKPNTLDQDRELLLSSDVP